MAFLGGNNNELILVLTQKGLKTLSEKGLENTIVSYNFYDDELNYVVDAYPSLEVDICGSNKTITNNNIILRNELKP
jgi:hypothetical protein